MAKKSLMLRVEPVDLAKWQECADNSGLTLSEWMRRRCNGEGWPIEHDGVLRLRGNIHASDDGPESDKGSEQTATGHRERKPRKAEKTCPHGFLVGWRCTLCGGIVR